MESQNNPNGKAIASLVVSIVAFVCGCCAWYLAILCGAIAVVLGVLALRGENKRQTDLAIAGIVVGGTGIAMGIVAAVLYICVFMAAGEMDPVKIKDGSDEVLMAVANMMSILR